MDIQKSIFSLAKTNNGFFKSEKQADFLINQMKQTDGCIGHYNSGYNSCPIFSEWDNEGITKITKKGKNKETIVFERKQEGILTAFEVQELKSIKRKINALEKQVSERIESYNNGSYNGTGDISTYSVDMTERYLERNKSFSIQIENLKERAKQINGIK